MIRFILVTYVTVCTVLGFTRLFCYVRVSFVIETAIEFSHQLGNPTCTTCEILLAIHVWPMVAEALNCQQLLGYNRWTTIKLIPKWIPAICKGGKTSRPDVNRIQITYIQTYWTTIIIFHLVTISVSFLFQTNVKLLNCVNVRKRPKL